jgi:pimeloyl-ACP methyl ester carboxylesterase
MNDHFADVGRGITLCYRTDGDPNGTPLLLVAGLSVDLTVWPKDMVDGLVAAGFYVIRFDNRDIGRSTQIDKKAPSPLRQLAARPHADAYDLGDMAADAVGLLDHLGIGQIHVVGMSMGGMIAQTIAARYPDRVTSLTSIFSTTGNRSVGQPRFSTMLLLAAPPARTKAQSIARHLRLTRHIASTGFPFDEDAEWEYAIGAWNRGARERTGFGVARQISAIQKSGDRTAELAGITARTLVIHGDRDRIVDPSGGRATAAAITGARHVVIAGMGHDFPAGVIPRLLDLITNHVGAGHDSSASGAKW